MDFSFLRSTRFWSVGIAAALVLTTIFAWELNWIEIPYLPVLPRPFPTQLEVRFTILMIALLSIDAGLLGWEVKHGTCSIGARRATTIGSMLGMVTLLCPVCLIIPFSLFGLTLSLTFLVPYLPLLRLIVVILLIATTVVLLPKKKKK